MKKIFFHSDLDGYVSGSIIKSVYRNSKCYECRYNNRLPVTSYVSPSDFVIIADYSFTPEEMLWLKANCRNVIWIDHHISAIKDSEKYGYDDLPGKRSIEFSGAELTWMFFYNDAIPEFIQLVGSYDTFREYGTKKFQEIVLPFYFGSEIFLQWLNPLNYGKKSYIFDFDRMDELKDRFIRLGQVIYNYKRACCKKVNEHNAFVKNLFGFRVLCLNTCNPGSLDLIIPGTFDPEKHDMMLCYNFNGKQWDYGFYTNGHPEVDCSRIAKMYGGGGHKQAARAVTNKPIF